MLRSLRPLLRSVQSSRNASSLFRENDLTKGKKTILACLYEAGEAGKNPVLLGCKENALGIRKWLEDQGHKYIVTSSKDGPNNEFDKYLPEADIVITTPFHPGYITKERIARAPKLKLSITAGIGSDHVDLIAAKEANMTVAEVTGSNVVSVAEHVVMSILVLIRNFVPAHDQIINGEWDVAKIAQKSWDLEGKVVGTVGCGRIGQRVLKRLGPFDCKELLYSDYTRLPESIEKDLNCRYVSLEELVSTCDVITINCPLHEGTEHLFDKKLLMKMKKGAFLVNTARGKIVNADDLAEVMKSGHLNGYAGDVWYPQPAPKDHPWRRMPNHALTPHISGTSIDAQQRYASGTKEILRRSFAGEALIPSDVIVQDGKIAPQYDKTATKEKRSLVFDKGWEKQ
jgi:formate dehydrogenase